MLEEEFLKINNYLREGKMKKALNFFKQLLEKYPQSLPLKLSFANFLLKLGEFFEALKVLREGLKVNPYDLNLRYLLGVAQQKVNRFRLAEKEFEFLKSKKPFDPEIKRQLGWTKVMMGEIEEGRKLLREAISADLINPLPYADLGVSYIFTLDFDEGFYWLEIAKNLKPEDPFILNRIEETKRIQRDFEKFSEKEKKKMREMRKDPQELKMMAIRNMLTFHLEIEPTKEEIEDVKKELEMAGLSPKLVEFSPPKTKEEKTYFEYLKFHQIVENLERKINKEEFQKLKEKLLNPKTETEEIKKILIILAHQGTKEAIKLLENYEKMAPVNLKDFLKLALEECKILFKTPPGKMIKIIH